MAPKAKPPWQIYKEQMECFRYGHALWEPAPTNIYTPISIGDVGFIRQGQFHLLFSAGLPLGERKLGDDVPNTFEQLEVGRTEPLGRRDLGCIEARTSRQVGGSLDVTMSNILSLEPGVDFSLELTGDRGAALTTRHPTYTKDSQLDFEFKEYTKRHYSSWVQFASDKKHGKNLRPVLVSGFDAVKDFAMIAYSNNHHSDLSGATHSTPMFGSASPSWGVWLTAGTPHVKHGPQQLRPQDLPPSQSGADESPPAEFNQCVFIRYYTMREGLFPRAFRADTGPDGADSGEHGGNTFPGLTMRPDVKPAINDEDPRGQRDPATNDAGSDMVIPHVPYDEEYDSWDAIADYVFQNSNATSVLMHNKDLAAIRAMGHVSDISSLLAIHKPRIVVDEDGVGGIIRGEGTLLSQGVAMNLKSESHDGSGARFFKFDFPMKRTGGADYFHRDDVHDHYAAQFPSVHQTRQSSLHLDSGSPAFKRLISRNFSPTEVISLLNETFWGQNEVEMVYDLHGEEAQEFINVVDKVLDLPDISPWLLEKSLSALINICDRQALLPRSIQIPLCYDRSGEPLYSGGLADVWIGEHQGNKVAVKVLRVFQSGDLDEITSTFCREVIIWRSLRHPNVLPLLGVTMSDRRLAMVSEWMVNGNINEFVKMHRDVNRFDLLKDVARGLMYMHDLGMVHGNLKGANILIDQHYHARLTDPGLLTFVSNPTNPSASGSFANTGGTTRWMSPELLYPEKFGFEESRPSKESDYYAMGMVILEVLSGQAPFARYKEIVVARKVVDGEHPERLKATWFTDDLWRILEQCWSSQPKNRPTVEIILHCLDATASTDASGVPPSSLTATFQSTEKQGRRDFAGVANDILPDVLQQDPLLCASTSSSARDPTREIICREPADPGSRNNRDISELPVQAIGEGGESGVGKRTYPKNQQLRKSTGMTTISASICLNEVANWDGMSPNIKQVLTTAFGAKDYPDCIKNLQAQGIKPLTYINSLDRIIDSLQIDSQLRRRCLKALSKTCGLYGILPTSHEISSPLTKPGPRAFTSGGFSDVWKLSDLRDNNAVFAAKSLRVYEQDPVEKIRKNYCKGVVVGKRANHQNLLPIEGVAPELFEFCIVSRWMENGNILAYVTNHPGVNRLELLIGVTRGLDYLHHNEVVHGDLKSPNILIDRGGSPRLADFGFCSITKNMNSINASVPIHGSTVRYLAPELLDPGGVVKTEKKRPTSKSDVYSLSMVIIELVTGKVPLPDFTDANVTVMISKGKRPPKPHRFDAPGTSPAVWKVAKKCWHERAKERPEVKEVLRNLEKIANSDEERRPPSPFKQVLREFFSQTTQ